MKQTISYKQTIRDHVTVYFGPKWIGEIKPTKDNRGFYYQPRGSSLRGDIFQNISSVKLSLESES